MATLFGGGMDEQAMQRQLINQRAAEFAQLNPSQRLAQMGYSAGASLGGGLAKAMGVDVTDPTIKRASMLRSLASKYDTTTPEGLTQLAQELRTIDPDMAMQVSKAAQDMRLSVAKVGSEEALAKQRSKEEKAADPFQKLLEKGIYKPSSLAAFKQSGDAKDLQFKDSDDKTQVVDTEAGQLLINSATGATVATLGKKPGAGIKYSVDTEELSAQLYNKPYQSLTQEERTKVLSQKQTNELAARRAGASNISNVLKQPPAVVASIDAFDKATEALQNMLKSAALSKQLISEASASNNSQTWEAARTTVAKAVGENKLSNEDIKRTGVDPRLVQGALDWVNKKVSGVPNQDIMKQLYVLSSVLENNATQQINTKADRARAAARASGFEGDVDVFFPKVGAVPAGKGTDADKEARYQAYKKAQQGK